MHSIIKCYYSYDIHGNVDTLLQDYGNSTANPNAMNLAGNRYKKLVYDYDLISGKVNMVTYQPDYFANNVWKKPADQFFHRYSYDAENRLTFVETSSDKMVWERDARYYYYKHGPLARVNLGELQVQGVDYAYTLQGWLKGINGTSVEDGSFDMGGDGKIGGANSNIARDAYGISLNYFTGDYKPIGQGTSGFANPFAGISVGSDLFNGNIKAQVVNIPKLGDPLTYAYKYDQLNRLVEMDAYNGLNNVTNTFTAITIDDYKERLTYDANGNIKTYLRNGTGSSLNLNNYTYTYTAGTNRLASINNSVNAQTKTYSYDAIGNTTADGMQGMTNAVWNVYGKLQSATNAQAQSITYTYDAAGQRISKKVGSVEEWYVKDAGGNTMLTYTKDAAINNNDLTATAFYKYGSSLLSVKDAKINVEHPVANNGTTTFERGNDNYILTDANGNTRVTIKDTRTQVPDPANPLLVLYYTANVSTATFSSTYGANAKTFNGGFEAANFNGQRKSLEIGEHAQTALFWEYNGDVGRRWNIDPKPADDVSVYATFRNNPILNIDIFGDTLRGANNASAQTELNLTQTFFAGTNALPALFSVGSDGMTFNPIDQTDFLDALDANLYMSEETRDLAWGYYLAINSTSLLEVSYIRSTDPNPATGLDPVRHAPFITFLNANYATMALFNNDFGGQATFPAGTNRTLSIFQGDVNPTLGDFVNNAGGYTPGPSSQGSNNVHEIIGHGLASVMGLVSATQIEAIQMENIFYRATGHLQRDGTDHGVPGTPAFTVAERTATPAQLIGNRIRRTVKPGESKFKHVTYDYENY